MISSHVLSPMSAISRIVCLKPQTILSINNLNCAGASSSNAVRKKKKDEYHVHIIFTSPFLPGKHLALIARNML